MLVQQGALPTPSVALIMTAYDKTYIYERTDRPGSMSPGGMRAVATVSVLMLVSLVPTPAMAVDSSYLDFYISYDEMVDEILLMQDEHPDIVMVVSIGVTYEGRDIWAVKVSDNVAEDEDEPEVLITSVHHAKEWPGLEVVMATLRQLVEGYGKGVGDLDGDGFSDGDDDMDGAVDEDPYNGADDDGDGLVDEDWSSARISWLVDNREIWFIPVLNPDGLEYCRQQVANGVTDEGQLWRKNREPNYQDLGPAKGLTYGVDLNRNYGFHWGELGAQSYANSAAEDYIGPVDKSDDDGDRRINEDNMDNMDNDGDGLIDEDGRGGFTATETKAIKAMVEEHEFSVALHMHTFKGTIYWPWMFTLQLPEDEDTFERIAREMNVFNGYEFRDMDERNQQTYSRHPPVDGDSNDWFYGKHDVISFTIELGYNMFIPGGEELAGIVAENLGANLVAIEEADHPRREPVVLEHTPLEDTTSTDDREVTVRVGGGELVPGGMTLVYRLDDGKWRETTMMADAARGGYAASIPGADEGTGVQYYFVARGANQGTSFLPAYGPYEVFGYSVLEPQSSGASVVVMPTLIILLVVVLLAYINRRRLEPVMRRGLRLVRLDRRS